MQITVRRFGHGPALAACALAGTLSVTSAATAAPTNVNLRIEGASSTIFEGPVTTDGRVVEPATGEKRRCDGMNGGANPQPGPTPTTALDDGARQGGFQWDGDYFDSFNDYLVKRIGPDRATETQFFGQYVNSQASQAGGCQEIVKSGDEVLWAFDAFSKKHVLRLAGPSSAVTGQPFAVRVTDGADGAPVAAATVNGTATGADGSATLTFPERGIYRLKAERSDSVRSNALSLCVDPPDADPCTSTDRIAPKVSFSLPRIASDVSRSRKLTLSWQGIEEPGGSGITGYAVEVRPAGSLGPFRTVVARTALTRVEFEAEPGAAYEFRVLAIDRAGNRGIAVAATTAVPVDDLDSRLISFSKGWKSLQRGDAWGGTVRRSTRRGATAQIGVEGLRVALIGRRLRKGGKLRLSVAGRSKLLRLRGAPRFREVLYVSAPLPRGPHPVVLKTGRGPVEIDAVAVLR